MGVGTTTKRVRGFTIVELLIVVVVIAILAAITIVAYNGVANRAKQSAAQETARQVGTKVAAYAVQNGDDYPSSPSALGFTNSDTTFYEWSYNNSVNPHTFCATITFQSTSYYISNTNLNPTNGLCAGHNGGVGLSCPAGFIVVPGSSTYGTSDFCVMKYEAKNSSNVAVSQAAGEPWGAMSQTNAISKAATACSGCHLITEAEWLTIAQNVMSVASNWSGGSVGSGYIYQGHSDAAPFALLSASTNDSDGYYGTENTNGNQRRTLTLTNGNVIWDLSGNIVEWTNGTATTGKPGGSGYGWRQWNATTVTGTLTPNPYPSNANPAASAWTSSNGLGQLYSNSSDNVLRGFLRGGNYNTGAGAGIYMAYMTEDPSVDWDTNGFRAAK